MFPIIQVGPVALAVPGLVLITGLWIGLSLSERFAPEKNVDPSRLYNLALVILTAGLVGARTSYLLRYPGAFIASPLSLVSLNPGLLDPIGGVGLGLIVGLAYAQRYQMKFWPTLDAITPALAVLGVAFGIVHFAEGTAYGAATQLPWGIDLWGTRRHPTQLYEIVAALGILALIWFSRKKAYFQVTGRHFIVFMGLSASARLFLEAFRGDSYLVLGGFRSAQIIAWLVLAVSLVMLRNRKITPWLCMIILLTACQLPPVSLVSPLANGNPGVLAPASFQEVPEQPVSNIPLEGMVSKSDAEISGMSWYQDNLILLPQYPERFAKDSEGALFYLTKTSINAYLDGVSSQPLNPSEIPLYIPGLPSGGLYKYLHGFEGFEAIGFSGNQAYLTIETKGKTAMLGYLISGTINSDLSAIQLDLNSLMEIEPQAAIPNLTDETLVVVGHHVITMYEANGVKVNPSPVAHVFEPANHAENTITFPNIEYRVTDATTIDHNGRFWVMNFFFSGDTQLKIDQDPLFSRFGKGPTHAEFVTVERLIELQYRPDRITLVDKPPIQLQLIDDLHPRNWEALARLDDRGFLVATDKFPQTLFSFVPSP